MSPLLTNISATLASQELAKVQNSLNSSSQLPLGPLVWFVAGLAVLVTILLFFNWRRKKKQQNMFQGWVAITDQDRIAAILKRAVLRQARYTLEVFEKNHADIYRGLVHDSREDSHLVLELAAVPKPGANFEGAPVQVHLNFRPSLMEPMEHYQFSTHSLALNYKKESKGRVARVAVAWPKSIISAQRRDFIRLELVGAHSMSVELFNCDGETVKDMDSLMPAATGSVLDISLGGIQLLVPGFLDLPPEKPFLMKIELPMKELDLTLPEAEFYFMVQPLVMDVIGLTPPGGDQPVGLLRGPDRPSDKNQARTIVRGRFIGRYKYDRHDAAWNQIPFKVAAFQDLAHWINAYQRFLLKKEKGLMPMPEERVNMYPAIPPDRDVSSETPDDE
ncbi:hypothetical protein C4J81_04610 [Deltaproteobacteria bacterium Smac51]|nr:hypothetical protein C4J81_04610 [Deltaproteobacteria bacterium Smac51]